MRELSNTEYETGVKFLLNTWNDFYQLSILLRKTHVPNEVSFNSDYFKINFQDRIDVSDVNYVFGVTSFNTYNSIFNINSKINKIVILMVQIVKKSSFNMVPLR